MSAKIFVINRGDTFKFKIQVVAQPPYRLALEDNVYFGLMHPNQKFEDALIRKKYNWEFIEDDGTLLITLKPEDTLNLCPGVYYYAIKIHKVNTKKNIDEVETLVKKTKFIIND